MNNTIINLLNEFQSYLYIDYKSHFPDNDIDKTSAKVKNVIQQVETVYYKDIVALCCMIRYFLKFEENLLLSDSDSSDIRAYIGMIISNLSDEIIDEQNILLEENTRFVKKSIEEIKIGIISNNHKLVIASFNKMFLKTHSKHYNKYLNIISQKYDLTNNSLTEHRNLETVELLDLCEKIIFEKELIHKEILKNKLLTQNEVIKHIDYLLHGNIEQSLILLERASVQLISKIPNSLNIIRTPVVLSHKYYELLDKRTKGIASSKNYISDIKNVIDDIFEYLEIAILTDKLFLLTGVLPNYHSNSIDDKFKIEIKTLISKGKLEKSIELLLKENIDDDIKNQLILQKLRLTEHIKQSNLGLDIDNNLTNKIGFALLSILDSI